MPATFNNFGTINNVSFYGDADAKVINSGTINLDSLSSSLCRNIMGTGTINLGTVYLYGTSATEAYKVSTGQTINIQAGSKLYVETPADFHATIANLAGDIYVNLYATSETYDNGRLTLFDGTKAVDVLHLHRPAGTTYSTASFHVDRAVGLLPGSYTHISHV